MQPTPVSSVVDGMSALYNVEARQFEGVSVDLRVTPTQPDCCPFYVTPRFALGLIADARAAHHPLRDALAKAYEHLGHDGHIDCARFVADVRILEVSTSRWDYWMPDPWAIYRVEVTRAQWLAHVRDGATWESVAYDEVEPHPYLNLMQARSEGPVIGGGSDGVEDPSFLAAFG